MSNPSGRLGSFAETQIVNIFRRRWPEADRRKSNGKNDRGDLSGVPGLCVEMKGGHALNLGPWMTEAVKERLNAGAQWAVVAHRRWGKGNAEDWFVTMPLGDFVELYALYSETRAR